MRPEDETEHPNILLNSKNGKLLRTFELHKDYLNWKNPIFLIYI